jgi:hypothetical protein
MKKDLEKNRPLPTIEKSDAKEDYELYGSKWCQNIIRYQKKMAN